MSDKHRLLIVEDDLDLAEMLSSYFRALGYDTFTASWGKDALEVSSQETLHLIMLDIRLPDIDGYEVCRQLRSQRRTMDVPIIFLTEKRDRVDKLQGLELGVVDYITKPFDIQELRLRVRNAIARASRPNLSNPVTELPENDLALERLNGLLLSDTPWAALLLSLAGIVKFREAYGFVAADDVLRAVTLMIRGAVREHGSEDDFIGHLNTEDFLIVTTPEKVNAIRERVENRVRLSREYFYRDRDQAQAIDESSELRLRSGIVQHTDGPFADADALKAALYTAAVPT